MLIDLHVHSPATPGCTLQPAQVLARAAERGLDGVAFTDLNSLSAAQALLAMGQGGPAVGHDTKLAVFVGVELRTDHGHYLAFFADPTKVPEPAQLFGAGGGKPWPTREVLERVTELGGVAVAALPYDRDIDYPSGDYIFGLKAHLVAVEGLNAQQRPGTNDLAVEASGHLGVSCVGGSSATSLAEVGQAATCFADSFSTHAELVAALKSGRFFPVGAGHPPPLTDLARAPRLTAERFERSDRGGRDRGDRGGRDRRGGRGGRRGGRSSR